MDSISSDDKITYADDLHDSFQDEYEEETDAPYSEEEKVLDAEGMPLLLVRARVRTATQS